MAGPDLNTVAQSPAPLLSWAHDALDLTWDEVGALVQASGRTVRRWLHGGRPSAIHAVKLKQLAQLRFFLDQVFGADLVAMRRWLNRGLLDLGGRTPVDAIRDGEIETITIFLATELVGAFI